MLLSSPIGYPPRILSGFRGGLGAEYATAELTARSTNLKALQQALVELSNAAHNPAINPGTTSGTLSSGLPDDKTMAAVAAAMGLIGPHLPKYAQVALVIALGIGASTNAAKTAVADNAKELTTAVKAATVAAPFYANPEQPATPETPSIFSSSGPWYQTWWGVGAIATAAIGTIALVAARRRAMTPATVSGYRRR